MVECAMAQVTGGCMGANGATPRERGGQRRDAIAHYRASDGEFHPLRVHSTETSTFCGAFAAKLGLPLAGELMGLLHDLGKYHREFQAYLASAIGLLDPDEDAERVDAAGLKGRIDHSTAGAQLVWQKLSPQGKLQRGLGQVLAVCMASHHSGLIDCLGAAEDSLGGDAFAKRMAKPEERSHASEAWNSADAAVRARALELLAAPSLAGEFSTRLHGIGAAAGPLREVINNQLGLLARFLFSCLVDADRRDTAGFMRPRGMKPETAAPWADLGGRLEQHLAAIPGRRAIDGLRRDISDHCLAAALRRKPGLYSLTVPTGGGKTLASLRFALRHAREYQMERVFYFVPFTAIIDQNAKVVRDILDPSGGEGVVLEHHSNLTPDAQGWREKLLAEAWEAPVIFTTMVQLLETLFGAGTRGARRMHRLARSVLIFDEIQTLPIRCVHLFANAVNFLVEQCGCTVILCTATQPLLDQVDARLGAIRRAADAEIMPDAAALFRGLKRVEIRDRHRDAGWSDTEIGDEAIAELERAGSCLIIVNTKKSARRLYSLCRGRGGAKVFHLSTGMCPAHRRQVLAEVQDRLDKKLPVLCISTQLIEAGVDISFGTVIRFAAGLDSIAQAAGRCNRNRENDVGIVHVVNSRDEVLGDALRDIAIAQAEGARVLREYAASPEAFEGDPLGPKAMTRYYEYYFFARQDEMAYPLAAKALGHSDTLHNLLSSNTIARARAAAKQDGGGDLLAQSFMTAAEHFKAIDAPTDGVIVPYGEGRTLIEALRATDDPDRQRELLRQAQQFAVSVFPGVLGKMEATGGVHRVAGGARIYWCGEHFYHPDTGLDGETFGNGES